MRIRHLKPGTASEGRWGREGNTGGRITLFGGER